ncbi:50S ribosomal protein L25 [Candidatus Woesebacteria bacterium]|nr:50S ribosomal protein L25 [Candidatus Woesebacteria bacterium]
MTNTNIVFHVTSRKIDQKMAQVRLDGLIPANIYGLSKDSTTVSIPGKSLFQHLKTEGETGLLYLIIDEKNTQQPVLFSEIQKHPVTNEIVHVSFLRVNLAEKITKEIDVKLVGEFDLKEATVILVKDVIEVEALPADLPEAFFIDVSKLTEVGQEVRVADLEFDRSKVELQMTEEEQDEPIALVQEVKEEVAEEPEVEVAPADGAAPAVKTDDAEPAEEDSKE